MSNKILIQQSGNKKQYLFDITWARPGGALHGDNFLTDICVDGCVHVDRVCVEIVPFAQMNIFDDPILDRVQKTKSSAQPDLWVLRTLQSDPDFLLILWLYANKKNWLVHINKSNVLAMVHFFSEGFPQIYDEIIEKYNKKESSRYCYVV